MIRDSTLLDGLTLPLPLTLASSLLHVLPISLLSVLRPHPHLHPSSSPTLLFIPHSASRIPHPASRIPPSALKLNPVHVGLRLYSASAAGAKALHPLQNPCVLDSIREIARWPLTRPRALALLSDIRNANDAHRIFEAVRLGLLPLVTRRLTPTERDLLRSGQVFVWEEGSSSGGGAEDGTPSAGLERWTDGRRWYVRSIPLYHPISSHLLPSFPPSPTDDPSRSQSRMREPFLFYEEKIQTTQEEKHQKAIRRARKASTASEPNQTPYDPPIRRQDRPSKPDGLTKQTYSCKHLVPFAVEAPFLSRPSYSDLLPFH